MQPENRLKMNLLNFDVLYECWPLIKLIWGYKKCVCCFFLSTFYGKVIAAHCIEIHPPPLHLHSWALNAFNMSETSMLTTAHSLVSIVYCYHPPSILHSMSCLSPTLSLPSSLSPSSLLFSMNMYSITLAFSA